MGVRGEGRGSGAGGAGIGKDDCRRWSLDGLGVARIERMVGSDLRDATFLLIQDSVDCRCLPYP